jgi:hypothetical protein
MRATVRILLSATALCLSSAVLSSTVVDARPREFSGGFWNYYDYPWCIYTMNDFNECSFESLEQCNATRAGVGGTCYRNPRLVDVERDAQPPGAKRLRRAKP